MSLFLVSDRHGLGGKGSELPQRDFDGADEALDRFLVLRELWCNTFEATGPIVLWCPSRGRRRRSILSRSHRCGRVPWLLPEATGTVRVPVSSYVRLDLGVTWRPTKALELGIWGQNLLDNQHPEFYNYKPAMRTEVARSVLGKVTWRF